MHLAVVTVACLEHSVSPRVIFYMAAILHFSQFSKVEFFSKVVGDNRDQDEEQGRGLRDRDLKGWHNPRMA